MSAPQRPEATGRSKHVSAAVVFLVIDKIFPRNAVAPQHPKATRRERIARRVNPDCFSARRRRGSSGESRYDFTCRGHCQWRRGGCGSGGPRYYALGLSPVPQVAIWRRPRSLRTTKRLRTYKDTGGRFKLKSVGKMPMFSSTCPKKATKTAPKWALLGLQHARVSNQGVQEAFALRMIFKNFRVGAAAHDEIDNHRALRLSRSRYASL